MPIVNIVPITRLRRNTSWWSYKTTANQFCPIGSLVVIPFKNQLINGIVWSIESKIQPEIEAKLEKVHEVTQPHFLLPQHLRFIEWLSDYAFCSLSHALYMYLPAAVRKPSMSKSLISLHQKNKIGLTRQISENAVPAPQSAYIFPYENIPAIEQLTRVQAVTLNTFYPKNDLEELIQWYSIRMGNAQQVIGRERAVFAPYRNLKQIEIFSPEDVSYYTGQAPYFNLTEAAKKLSEIWNSPQNIHSHLDINQLETPRLDLIDIRKEGLLGDYLVKKIQEKAQEGQVVIIYNKHDQTEHIISDENKNVEFTVRKPGVESLRSKLAVKLNRDTELPANILMDTRKILRKVDPKKVSLYVMLTSDHLTKEILLPNILDNSADIFRIIKSGKPFVLQTGDLESPIIQALRSNNLPTYLNELIEQYRQNDLPPYKDLIVCSYPGEDLDIINALKSKLPKDTESSAAFTSKWHGKQWSHLIIYLKGGRTSKTAKDLIMALPAPWRIQRNPWYVI